MTLDTQSISHDNSGTCVLNLDHLTEVLNDVLSVPSEDGLARLVQIQVARAAASEAPAPVKAADADLEMVA